jgi:hypothetical protein
MAKVAFPITIFTDSEDNALSFGYVFLNVSEDVSTPNSTQIGQGSVVTITLDENGTVEGSPTVWPNAELQPSGSTYVYSVYSAMGQLVADQVTLTV